MDSTTIAMACGDDTVRLMTIEDGVAEVVEKCRTHPSGIVFGVEAAPHILIWCVREHLLLLYDVCARHRTCLPRVQSDDTLAL
jgi:hypothetical protein